jgi:hypothetical protein
MGTFLCVVFVAACSAPESEQSEPAVSVVDESLSFKEHCGTTAANSTQNDPRLPSVIAALPPYGSSACSGAYIVDVTSYTPTTQTVSCGNPLPTTAFNCTHA